MKDSNMKYQNSGIRLRRMTSLILHFEFYLYISSQRLKHCHHVLGRRVALNIVNSTEDKAFLCVENLHSLCNLPAHLVRLAERQRLLRVGAASPKDNSTAVFVNQQLRVHTFGGSLNGIKNIETRIDESLDQWLTASAAMFHRLPFGVGMDPIV